MIDIDEELAVRAFQQGFFAGANPIYARRRHTVDYATHEHWRRGLEAGRRALDEATAAFRSRLK